MSLLSLFTVAFLIGFAWSCAPAQTPCELQTSVDDFATAIGGCSPQGVCDIPCGESRTISACNDLNIISTQDPRGATMDIPTAEPDGRSNIQLACSCNGGSSVRATGFTGGATQDGVRIIDQLTCTPAVCPCEVQTSVSEFAAAIGGCNAVGVCNIPCGESRTIQACNSLNVISGSTGATLDIPTAQPAGTSAITLTCGATGGLTASGFANGGTQTGVTIIDQTACFPCRFQSTVGEVTGDLNAATANTCNDAGVCDLVIGAASITINFAALTDLNVISGMNGETVTPVSIAANGDTQISCNANGEVIFSNGFGPTTNVQIIDLQ